MMKLDDLKTASPIVLQGLSRRFGERVVLDALDLHIPQGQFLAIVGRSGCGKSTLLRLLAGLDQADGGLLQQPAGQSVRVMFQEARLLPWKSVLDNVALGLPASRRGEAEQALAEVGLADRAQEWPARLSGGQRQRVALARALVHQPSLLLLDEPLGALDALTRLEMQGLIERLWQQHGCTTVLVTHDVSEAVTLADRVVLLEEGRVALDLPVELPRSRDPADSRFVALEQHILQRVLQGPSSMRHLSMKHRSRRCISRSCTGPCNSITQKADHEHSIHQCPQPVQGRDQGNHRRAGIVRSGRGNRLRHCHLGDHHPFGARIAAEGGLAGGGLRQIHRSVDRHAGLSDTCPPPQAGSRWRAAEDERMQFSVSNILQNDIQRNFYYFWFVLAAARLATPDGLPPSLTRFLPDQGRG
jgi:sulfonate transport system ATP-binding protein